MDKIKKIKFTMTIKIPVSSLSKEEKKEMQTGFEEMRSDLHNEAVELGRDGVETSLGIEEVEE